MPALGQNGVIQFTPPAQLEQQLSDAAANKAAAAQPANAEPQYPQLAGYVKAQFEIFRNHRNTNAGWSNRMLAALRSFNGQYDPTKLAEVTKFGGSTVYARMIAQKCRAASSLLRDIYLGQDMPWALQAPQNPEIPKDILAKIDQLVQQEAQQVQQQLGTPASPSDLQERKRGLLEQAEEAAKKKAAAQARTSQDKIQDMLDDGGYYDALAEFLVDLPIFPFACIKGPVVKVIPTVIWPQGGGAPTVKQTPTLTWNRVSPFDIWFTPGVADIENANVIEKLRVTRAELNDLLDLPGYNQSEIRAVLDEYGRGGLYDNWDTTDAERSVLENRENPAWNRSGMISMMEFNGNVQGRMLQDYGMVVQDELRDYHVQIWVVGSHVIKCHLSPSPRQRHPYFITSFEKVPGTPVGNGLTDLLADLQESANATLRALLNNIAISSGPQVVINDDMLAPEENGEDMYPWKRWHTRTDPMLSSGKQPITFFMPASNAQALMQVYEQLVSIADDVSAIPKYVGGQAGGGAGRTASGLAMLMGNASKILQTVSANIDRDVIKGSMVQLQDLLLLTDTSGLLTGEENLTVQGVNVAIQRETLRQRQIEFLTATNNPTDQKIMGMKGRAVVLRSVSTTIGMPGEEIVPPEDEIDKMVAQQKQAEASGSGPIDEAINKAVIQGVEQGVKRITLELTAGRLAMNEGMTEGPPAHVGTPGAPAPGQGQSTGSPGMDMGEQQQSSPQVTGSPAHGAAQAQGAQPGKLSMSMGPQTHITGNQNGAGAMPVSGGVG
jgi:hypothetical protein